MTTRIRSGCFSTLVPCERLRGQRRRCAAQDERQPGADADAVQAPDEKIAAGARQPMCHAMSIPACSISDPVTLSQLILRRAQHEIQQLPERVSSFSPGRMLDVPSLPRRKSTSTARSLSASGTRRNRWTK